MSEHGVSVRADLWTNELCVRMRRKTITVVVEAREAMAAAAAVGVADTTT